MKLGTDNKRNTILAAALFGVAILMFLRMVVFSNAGSAASVAPASAATVPAAHPLAHPPKRAGGRAERRLLPALNLTPGLDPRLRIDLLAREEQQEYKGNGRNIFAANSEPIPKPLAPGLKDAAAALVKKQFALTHPPPPPPINLKFFGYANKPGETKRVFLSQPDGNVLLAHEGDIVGQRYRILRIGPSSVEIEDVLSNNRQSIPLTQS